MGQVSGEYRSQRRKSYGQAFDGFVRLLPSSIDIDDTGSIICLVFVLSGFLSQHLHWDSFRDLGDFPCRWEGANVFLCPIFFPPFQL